jgi:hypothetical protein
MSNKLLAVILIAVFVLAIGGVGGYLWGTRQQQSSPRDFLTKPESSATPIQQSSLSNPPAQPLTLTPTSFPAAPSAASDQNFPTQQIDYPLDWPSDLRYPEQFILVETMINPHADGTRDWTAKLRYQGDIKTAANILSSFFSTRGFAIAYRADRIDYRNTAQAIVIFFDEGDRKNTGSLLLDSDTKSSEYTNILASISR